METRGILAKAVTKIKAPIDRVWTALVDPADIKRYMFGAEVNSEWTEGSDITWKGEWKGSTYEDKGKVLKIEKPSHLRYSHYSPLAGLPDKPENYHIVDIRLSAQGDEVLLELTQDNNASGEAAANSTKNWNMMLDSLRTLLEKATS
jgi:uncharacterized protein YndB with AHSA1/START domain